MQDVGFGAQLLETPYLLWSHGNSSFSSQIFGLQPLSGSVYAFPLFKVGNICSLENMSPFGVVRGAFKLSICVYTRDV